MITQISESVIWYTYKGDEIAWNGHHYLSILSGGSFRSLEEMDEFWEMYEYEYERSHYNTVQITHEMAMDAGDPSLEGEWIKW